MAKKSKNKTKQKNELKEDHQTTTMYPVWQKHPTLFSMGIILLLLIIFYYPVLFENKTLMPSDSVNAKCYKPFIQNALDEGTYPLWNPYVFAGMPSFASLSGAPYVNLTSVIIMNALKLFTFYQIDLNTSFWRLLPFYFLFGIFTFLLLRHFKLSHPIAFCATIAMVFMPEVIGFSATGHNTKLGCVMFMPLIFLLTDKLLNKHNLLNFSLLGLIIGLQFLWKHIQMTYLTLMLIGAYLVYWSIQTYRDEKKLKSILSSGALLFGAIILGFFISSVVYLSVWEYSHYSIRGGGISGGLDYDYATGWSFPPLEIVTFFVPSFMGFGGATYWGTMPSTHLPMYFGVITFMLAGLALIVNRNRTTWFFVIFAGIMLLLSFGNYFPILYSPFFKILPLFNKFRAPKIMLILFNIPIVILAGFGMQGIFDLSEKEDKKRKQVVRYLQIFCGIVFILFLILAMGKGAYINWADRIGRAASAAHSRALGDSLRALVFVIVTAIIIFLSLRKKIKLNMASIFLAGLIFIDLLIVNNKIVDPQPKRNVDSYFTKTPEIEFLKKQKTPFRILPFDLEGRRTANWYVYHGIESVDGYTAAKMKIFQDMLEAYELPTSHLSQKFVQKYLKMVEGRYALRNIHEVPRKDALKDRAFFKMYNIKYILSNLQLPDTTLRMIFPPQKRGDFGVFEFTESLDRAYFPKSIKKIVGKETILDYITSGAFDPEQTAILEKDPPFQPLFSDSNQASITSHGIHHLEIEANIHTPTCMVVSEMYYPAGWKAYVDGKETEIHKTNYVNRSIFLQPGKHTIRFDFKPKIFITGLWISIAVLVLLIIGIVVGMKQGYSKEKNLI